MNIVNKNVANKNIDLPSSDLNVAARTPHNIDVEAALLGALLRNNKIFEQISEITTAEHFYHGGHAQIFIMISRLLNDGRVANEDTLAHHAQADDILKTIGGASYITSLADNALAIISVQEYALLLKDLFLKRELIRIGEDCVLKAGSKTHQSANEQIENVEQKLFLLAEHQQGESQVITLGESIKSALDTMDKAIRNEGKLTGISTGLKDLDAVLGGLQKSDLIVLAGRPSMGKSAMALNIGYHAAMMFKQLYDENGNETEYEGAKVAVFSLEMSAEQIASRLLAAASETNSVSLRRGQINQEQFNRIARKAQEIDKLPLYIDESSMLTVSKIRQRARRFKRKHGLDFIIIDYLQLLQSGSEERADNRVLEISNMTRQLKGLARELNIPILILSQLSRAVENRDPPIPHLADLRDSGAIEQDADVVAFIYRPEYYLQRQPPERRENETAEKFDDRYQNYQHRLEESRNKAQLHIAKHRHGETGVVDLYFNPEFALFTDLEKRYD
ncbi:MAG: replicative DNA helicase [Alphaproteobacteria bacterium]|nr:replicative DNA helicase [Alphaproteobacteria bacterium]